ncbi:MAG: hypothetical protein HY744_28425 [Deltaproteobacteria bacterium]|nr:hypothetical protein [Deltaproteobacteria bacterium]
MTIVNGLHHFPLPRVRAVIEQVTARGAALFVAEGFTRSFWRASALGPAIGLGWAANPLLCQRGGLVKALLSGPMPLLTATGLWDWIASAMRIHEGAEIVALGRAVAPGYRWEHGVVGYPPWGRAVWVRGLPPDPDLRPPA